TAPTNMHTFVITVRPRAGDGWPVIAEELSDVDDLTSRSKGEFRFDLDTLAVEGGGGYGTRLGEALFRGSIEDAYLAARARSNDRLRVLLCVEDAVLQALRWERLRAPERDGWSPLAL